MSSLSDKLVSLFEAETSKTVVGSKISVVGVGQVGMASAFSIMLQGICQNIALIDIVPDKLKGEMMDMQHCQQFIRRCHVEADTDYKVTANSNIVVITAGARQREGESRLNLVQRNVDIFKSMIPKIVQNSPNCILVVVSNPVDVLAYVAWKLSGFKQERVIGTGTMLDSARFRYMISEKLGVSTKSCHAYIIGEHGDSSVPVWSTASVGGQRLANINPLIGKEGDSDGMASVHMDVVTSAYEIIKLKGYTSWAIGVSVAHLCQSILSDDRSVLPLSVRAMSRQGVSKDVFISLLAIISRDGVKGVVNQQLSEDESANLHKSVNQLDEIIQSIKW